MSYAEVNAKELAKMAEVLRESGKEETALYEAVLAQWIRALKEIGEKA